jgi:hypothetical protein
MTHGQEKSDLFIVALKPANKPGRLGAELVEPRERTEGNTGEQHTCRTLRRVKCVPEARLCTRSREAASWDSSLTTQGGSPVRESRPPGSVRGAPSNGCSYRDRTTLFCAPALADELSIEDILAVEHDIIPLDGADVSQQGEIDCIGDRVALTQDPGDFARLPVDDASQDRVQAAAGVQLLPQLAGLDPAAPPVKDVPSR